MHDNVGGAMAQTLRAHLFAAGLRDHLVVLIDDIHPLRACKMTLFHHRKNLLCIALWWRVSG